MQHSAPDIFKSDRAFVEYTASWLMGIGLPFLLLGVSCQIAPWIYCQIQLVPLFGGLGAFRPEFSAIAMPMALLILGMSIRMYSYFGWMVSIMLLACLDTLFISLVYVLFEHLTYAQQQVLAATDQEGLFYALSQYRVSIILDAAFAILCTSACIFFFLPGVRKLYWGNSFPFISDKAREGEKKSLDDKPS